MTPLPIHLPDQIRERLMRFMRQAQDKDRPWSQAAVAKAIGVSSALVSAFLNEDARGDVQRLCRLLVDFLNQQDAKAQAGEWSLPYVDIRQAKEAMVCLEYAAVHQEIVALIGDSGRGKSLAIGHFCRQNPRAMLIEASRVHGQSGVLKDLCAEVGESGRGNLLGLLKRVIRKLKGSQRLLIIDDAHRLGFAALDLLTTIYDRTTIGMVLSGISKLEHYLIATSPETEQLARRITFRRRLPEYVEADAEYQIARTLPHLGAGETLALFDPKAKSSPAWVGKVLKHSGKLAGGLEKVQLSHIKTALRMVV